MAKSNTNSEPDSVTQSGGYDINDFLEDMLDYPEDWA